MFKKISYLVLLLCLVMGAQVFLGCDANSGDDDDDFINMPDLLKGTWVSTYGEEYIITAKTFTSKYAGSVSYAGTVVNVREDGSGAGYITIKYTENSTYTTNAVGKYYVIHYKNLGASSMSLSSAYSASDPDPITGPYGASGGAAGKITQQEAEITYTVQNGYFGTYSAFHKTGSITKYPNKLEGSWSNSLYDTFVITDETIVYKNSGYSLFYGEIVNVRDNGETGYITFKYIENGIDGDLVGKYCVLYWENYVAATSADIAIASSNYTFGDEGQDTKEDAEAEYTADEDDYYDIGNIEACTKD
jgi:hypothetical protein